MKDTPSKKKKLHKTKHSPSKVHLSTSSTSDLEEKSEDVAAPRRFWFFRGTTTASATDAVAASDGAAAGFEHKPVPSKSRRAPSGFSLRRLFCDNLAQPFLQAANHPSQRQQQQQQRKKSKNSSVAAGGQRLGVGDFDGQSDTRSVWRDTLSSCSSHQGNLRQCPLCLSELTPDQFPVLKNCTHLFCYECLQTYIKIEVQEGRANLRCPQCTELMHPNDIEALIGDKNTHLFSLYESLMLRRILAVDPDTRWCPGPDCTYAVIAQGCSSCPKIDCERPGCGFSFCYHCKAKWHPNQTCDMVRAHRLSQHQSSSQVPTNSSASHSTREPISLKVFPGSSSDVKVCPRCNVLIVKMDDGSCNHMTCSVCGVEFCWLCMKEISDLHYLSPSGCTFWGKKPWSRKKKLLWQIGTIIGAPLGIAILAGISIPAMIIGIPPWVGHKIYDHYKNDRGRHRRNLAIIGGVLSAMILSPVIAGLVVAIGVPVLLCYVYAVVPIALCRSEGCGASTRDSSGAPVDIEAGEEVYRPVLSEEGSLINAKGLVINNPSIGEISLSLGSGCHLDDHDPESVSNIAIADASLAGSLASSYIGVVGGTHHKLEVGADVHSNRKKFSFSSDPLSETVSLSERSTTVSLADEAGANSAAASIRALAGSLQAYKIGDTHSISSNKTTTGFISGVTNSDANRDDVASLRSLPLHQTLAVHIVPRSMSPVSCPSADDPGSTAYVRQSIRGNSKKAGLNSDKQLGENSGLLCTVDIALERVRFDDNVSFIDDAITDEITASGGANDTQSNAGSMQPTCRMLKPPNMLETPVLQEETAEELAQVISPEPQPRSLSKQILSIVTDDHITRVRVSQLHTNEDAML